MEKIELERTFLARYIPVDCSSAKMTEIVDLYFPYEREHLNIRVRKHGDSYMITKKRKSNDNDDNDCSSFIEHTITIDQDEFEALLDIKSKRVYKDRYYYPYNGKLLEIDVFKEPLKGLILIEAEFSSEKEKNEFLMPEFCLVDVTNESFIAGGKLCGKQYADIEMNLNNFKYKKLYL